MKKQIETTNSIYPAVTESGEFEEIDSLPTDIMFRVDTTRDFKGTVFAVFPHECADYKGNVTTYQHIGQHSAGDYGYCIESSRPATPNEFADLKKEMEYLGYLVNVVRKQNRDKYLCSYKLVNGWK